MSKYFINIAETGVYAVNRGFCAHLKSIAGERMNHPILSVSLISQNKGMILQMIYYKLNYYVNRQFENSSYAFVMFPKYLLPV